LKGQLIESQGKETSFEAELTSIDKKQGKMNTNNVSAITLFGTFGI
jgi:hypothetical protein